MDIMNNTAETQNEHSSKYINNDSVMQENVFYSENNRHYEGVDEESIRDIAKSFNDQSRKSLDTEDDRDHFEQSLQKYTTIGGEEGVTPPVHGKKGKDSAYDPRLDPNSDDFSSIAWVQNMQKLINSDPDYYKPYRLGLTYKNVRAFGDSKDVAYQSTVANVFRKAFEWGARKIRKERDGDTFDILKPMDAYIKPASLTVVLGKPGSGCSTLLKTMCSNTHGFKVAKESVISYSGLGPAEISEHYRGEVVYNAETDVHFPHLTVYQTLNTIAKLVTPRNRIRGLTRKEFAHHMTEVTMATYGLSHARDTKVGNEFVRGASGGERKRVSIAEMSICSSKIQCWDNATRGLDSATALEFIKALKTSSIINQVTAVVAIYQCSQDAYNLFDNVCILDEGYQIYFGPGQAAKGYFQKMGYYCPERQTTADFLTAVTSPSERRIDKAFLDREAYVPRTPAEMAAYWKKSPDYQLLMATINEQLECGSDEQRKIMAEAHAAKQSKGAKEKRPYVVSYRLQVNYLLIRNFQRIRNNIGFTIFSVVGNSLMALILASLFYKIMFHTTTLTFYARGGSMFFAILFNSFSSLLEIMWLFEARPIVAKHKTYGLYRPSAEAFSSVISQMPSKIVTCIAFNLFFYFMVNFRRTAGHFFFYMLINSCAILTMSHIFRCVGSATRSLSEAMVPSSVALLAMAMYAGFALPKTAMLGWSKWIYWINPLQYGFESLMINEFHNRNFACGEYIPRGPDYDDLSVANKVCSAVGAVPGETFVNGDQFLRLSYGFEYKHKWRGFGVMVAFVIFFFVIYILLSEVLNSSTQKGEIQIYPHRVVKKLQRYSKRSSGNDIESGGNRERSVNDVTTLPIDNNDSSDSSSTPEKMVISDSNSSNKTQKERSGKVGLSESQATLHWRNICYDVQTKKETRRLLADVDGWVAKSSITALMGSSGAGKTTLLDCLASRITTGVISGDILVNGTERDKSFSRSIGYCQQQDLHLATATVRESLRFSAYMRQPATVSKNAKDEYVEEVIKILEMEKYADAVVGVTGEGLNVEQRKRLTIGVELSAKPQLLLFLDEPTSGLDSQTAWSICHLMRKLADAGQAILCTIHQPSAVLMEQFDRLLFLQTGGKTVYFGDLGEGCTTLIDYFERNGAATKCPAKANPAEWMLEVIGAAPGSHADQDYHKIWRSSEEYAQVQRTLNDMERDLPQVVIDVVDKDSVYAQSIFYQYCLVTHRLFQQYWRTPTFIFAKFFLTVYAETFIGFTFFKADRSLQGLQNQMLSVFMFCVIFNPFLQQYLPIFLSQRELYEARERPSKTVSWVAFMLAQITVELPYNILAGTVAFFCYYYPVGMYANASAANQLHERGAVFWLYAVAYYVFMGSFALLVASPFAIIATGGNLASLMFTMAVGFNGVWVRPDQMARFWIFMYRVSPLTYFISGALSTGLSNNSVVCSPYELVTLVPPQGQTCSEYLDPFFQAIGTGYLTNPNATSQCHICSTSTTNAFLKNANSSYDIRWRNWGIFISYIAFNYTAAVILYWVFRVPKSKQIKEIKRNEKK